MSTQANDRRPRWRYSLRTLMIAMAVIAISIVAVVRLGPSLFVFVVLGKGTVWLERSWPHDLRTLMNNLPDESRRQVRGMRVYCTQSFISSEHVCRFECSQEVFNKLCEINQLQEFPNEDMDAEFFQKPPGWWEPNAKADAICVAFVDHEYVTIMYDKKTGVAYGRFYFDF